MKQSKLFLTFSVLILISNTVDFSFARSANVQHEFRIDGIQTHWPVEKKSLSTGVSEEDEPGYWKKQLQKFGEVASRVGNSVGSSASSITRAIDKVCEVVKTIIPLLSAVCHVGQFKFCAATTGAPDELNAAISTGYADLNLPD